MHIEQVANSATLPVVKQVFLSPDGKWLMGIALDGSVVSLAEILTADHPSKGRKPRLQKTIGERKAQRMPRRTGDTVHVGHQPNGSTLIGISQNGE